MTTTTSSTSTALQLLRCSLRLYGRLLRRLWLRRLRRRLCGRSDLLHRHNRCLWWWRRGRRRLLRRRLEGLLGAVPTTYKLLRWRRLNGHLRLLRRCLLHELLRRCAALSIALPLLLLAPRRARRRRRPHIRSAPSTTSRPIPAGTTVQIDGDGGGLCGPARARRQL